MSKQTNKINNKEPLISFIMPCHNSSKTIEAAVESLLNQKYSNSIELIILNDGSTDNNKTHITICELTKRYDNIKYLDIKNNIGQANARNKGISIARGKYIGFLDSDDTVYKNLIENIIKYIDEKYDVIVWGLIENHIDTKQNLVNNIKVLPKQGLYEGKDKIIDLAKNLEQKYMLGYLWNKIYSKRFLSKTKMTIPNEHLIEDEMFNIEVFKNANKIYCINKPLYNYKRSNYGNDSLTSKELPDYFEQYYKRINLLYQWFKDSNKLDNDTEEWLGSQYLRYALSAVWRINNKPKTEKWFKRFYNLKLSKILLPKAKAKGKIAKINTYLFKHKLTNLIMLETKIITFTSKHMSKTMTKLKQSK